MRQCFTCRAGAQKRRLPSGRSTIENDELQRLAALGRVPPEHLMTGRGRSPSRVLKLWNRGFVPGDALVRDPWTRR